MTIPIATYVVTTDSANNMITGMAMIDSRIIIWA